MIYDMARDLEKHTQSIFEIEEEIKNYEIAKLNFLGNRQNEI